ncbi:serine/threonine-protein kinase TNNI3K-like isoform X2 [Halichondria panicea]|uniref:serine/threonine-protein kinase TNNI3K-like isoform X2 n=1 Tax=Halichondria panicea TaxID=6063 RepID=UPI00312BB70E
MERLHSDLADFVKKNPSTNLATRIHILYDVSKGLRYLHSLTPPLIHRDLTAPNILLTEDLTAKIGDLGVSRYVDPTVPTILSTNPGHLFYMSPESQEENPVYTTKLDIFSFGNLIIHTVIGDLPKVYRISASDPNEALYKREGKIELMRRNTSVHVKMGEDHTLYPLVVRCLYDRPEQRPAVEEVSSSLRELCHRHPRMAIDICYYDALYSCSHSWKHTRLVMWVWFRSYWTVGLIPTRLMRRITELLFAGPVRMDMMRW